MTVLPAENTPQGERILVVDDLPDNRELLQTVLEIAGYVVEVAESGLSALESIASHPPDLVLLDVMMPGMNGFEVTRRLRQNPSVACIPILLVTGYSGPMPADEFEVEADGFIYKPFELNCLLGQIQTFLQQRRSS